MVLVRDMLCLLYAGFFHLFTQFKSFFAPLSLSPISQKNRFLESLGKSNEKIFFYLTIYAHKGCKIAAPKKFFL